MATLKPIQGLGGAFNQGAFKNTNAGGSGSTGFPLGQTVNANAQKIVSQPKPSMGIKSTPIPTSNPQTTYTTNTPDTKAIENNLNNVKTQLKTAQDAGYSGSDIIRTNSTGNVIPKETYQYSNPGLLRTLADKGTQTGTEYAGLNKTLIDKNQELKNLRNEEATVTANVMGTPGPIAFKTGKAGVLQNLYAQKENALASEIGALSTQLGAANTQQGLQQSATTTALGSTQPTTQFGVLTDPQTGLPINGNSPSSAAFQGGQIQASQSQGGQYQSALANLQGGQNQTQQLNQLIQSAGVSPSDIVKVNDLLQRWSTEGVSNPNYVRLQSILSGINNSYSQILGNTVDVAQIAKQSNKSITEVINGLEQQAKGNVAALQSVGTGTPNTYQAPAPTSNTSAVSIGNSKFAQDANGNWIVAK